MSSSEQDSVAGGKDAMRKRRPRLLLSAYACNPFQGSEPSVGWNRALSAARHFDTWVLCAETPHGPDIRKYISEHGLPPGLHFIPIEKNRIARIARRVPGLYYLSYRIWQRQALRVARELQQQLHFDLIHQVTFCSYREPGYLWKLTGDAQPPAFLWGPLGGTQNFPLSMLASAGVAGACRELARTVINRAYLRWAKLPRLARRAANIVLAANTQVKRDLDLALGCDAAVLLETGLDRIETRTRKQRNDTTLRVLWCGAVEPWKAPRLLVWALAKVPAGVSIQVRVVGDGSQRKSCERICKRLNIRNRIEWVGRLTYEQSLRQYDWADAFVFTSMRDTSGNVILEALNSGCPVIAVDHQGARDIVTDCCGVKVPVSTPKRCTAAIAEAMVRLATDRELRIRLSEGARRRAGEYSWQRHGEKMRALYDQVLEQQ